MKYSKIFEPTNIGKLKLKNRTSMAPMGPVGCADVNGGFTQRLQDYYVERARNNVALIITGISSVDLNIEGLSSVIPCPTTSPLTFIHSTYNMNERIHSYGSKVFLQLTGGLGRSALPGFVTKLIAPSEQSNRFDPSMLHREMTVPEIQNMLQKFVMSAVIAQKSDFDGVEIHAVHEGYLLDQFAISIYNKRTDEYGGSLENRLKVATDIVKSIKKACGKDFPVSLRYSLKSCMKAIRQGGLPGEDYIEAGRDIEEGIEAAKILVDAGYDSLNVDAGTYDAWYWNHPPMYFEDGIYNSFGEILKKHVDVPIILAGRMDNAKMANDVIGKCCDIISYGRPLLADPEYVTKIRYGREDEIRHCLSCHEGCVGRASVGPVLSCAVNPACGREEIYGIKQALVKKHILVVGGGVAGLEVARVCTISGHKVTLCEKTDALGGNLIPGGAPDFKRYDHALIKYYERQMEILGVEVKMNTTVSADMIAQFGADVVVTATGSKAKELTFNGDIKPVLVEDVLMKKVEIGENVVLVGGGLVGCETALWLAKLGKKVNIVEIVPEILTGHGGHPAIPFPNYFMLKDLIHFYKIVVHTQSTIQNTSGKTVTIKKGDETLTLACDTLITSVGYNENNKLFEEISNIDVPVHNIGDSNKVHNIMYAIWDAYELARNI